jgi:hypothetical protein
MTEKLIIFGIFILLITTLDVNIFINLLKSRCPRPYKFISSTLESNMLFSKVFFIIGTLTYLCAGIDVMWHPDGNITFRDFIPGFDKPIEVPMSAEQVAAVLGMIVNSNLFSLEDLHRILYSGLSPEEIVSQLNACHNLKARMEEAIVMANSTLFAEQCRAACAMACAHPETFLHVTGQIFYSEGLAALYTLVKVGVGFMAD